MGRAGIVAPDALVPGWIDAGGHRRTYQVAPPPGPGAPILLVLHGAGGAGAGMAALTGLARRGPSAGFCTVFPDGWNRVWNDRRDDAPALRRRAGIDDIAFLNALIARLTADYGAGPTVWAAGISNGALLAEHAARHARLPLAGIALVAGSATVPSRDACPRPARPTMVVAFNGTADPLIPYGGGPIGPVGRLVQRRAARAGVGIGRGVAAPIEAVAADWAAANGCGAAPVVEEIATDLPVTRLSWVGPGRPAVVLHRIVGGGHT
jgi:polyhydroxybutyrate depolymerase